MNSVKEVMLGKSEINVWANRLNNLCNTARNIDQINYMEKDCK